ncbi:MAG: 30S ribosomal protein S9 [Candidatus Ratteibacteria bacterium]|jgi:small subunit ribosomal protein S9
MTENLYIAVGRRKSARAIVKMREGKGDFTVNGRPVETYFPLFFMRDEIEQPLTVTNFLGKFNLEVKAEGGGINGQIDAIKLGIARALVKFDPELTSKLREFSLLTRDPRMKERKKYGQKGARKRFQWTKR